MSVAIVVVHAVWATRGRTPIIDRSFEDDLHRAIEAKCRELRCPMIAVGSSDDHTHLLSRLHATIPVSRLVGEAKGLSAHVVNSTARTHPAFHWQEGYFAKSVDPDDVDILERYVRHQRQHHQIAKLVSDFELPDWQ